MTAQTTTPAELDDQVANDVARLAQLNAEIAERTEIADEIKTRLRALGPGRWTHAGRDVLDIGKPGLQFNATIAGDVIPAELRAACSETKVSGALAKKILPAELYAYCCTEKAAAVKTL